MGLIMMIKAVMFDLDGTLVNSLYDLANAVNFCLEAEGFKTHSVEQYKQFIGNGVYKLIERSLPQTHRTPEQINAVKDKYLQHYKQHCSDDTVCYDGIKELVASLRAKGIKLAVITNKGQETADMVVKKLFGNEFSFVIGQNDETPLKPDPKSAKFVMEKLGFRSKECLFVGDSGVDMQTALNAGAIPIGVLWGFREKQELIENGAEYTVEYPARILEIIEELR